VYGADEGFVTGTFAGITPVFEVDRRIIGSGTRGPMVKSLQQRYADLVTRDAEHRTAPTSRCTPTTCTRPA
jgi:branched-chain amino acid aminotransferase